MTCYYSVGTGGGAIFIFILILTSPLLTNVGQGGHNSMTNYCGPKNKC